MPGALITGGGGQLGKAFQQVLAPASVLPRSELDVTDRQEVLRVVGEKKPGLIVNAAAFTKVDAAEADPEGAYRTNVLGTRHVAEAAEAVGAVLVQVSTDYVFPGDGEGPYTEDDDPGPASVYGQTKLEGESAARACSRLLVVRTSWVFGEGHNFIRSILAAASAGAPELTVVGDQTGRPTYALHLAQGILALAEKGASGVLHLTGSGPPTTWAGLAEAALAAAGLLTPVRRISTSEYAASRSGPVAPRPANSLLDCSRAAALGVTLPPWAEAVTLYARRSLRPEG